MQITLVLLIVAATYAPSSSAMFLPPGRCEASVALGGTSWCWHVPAGCRVPLCGENPEGNAMWFGALCYMRNYNALCRSYYRPVADSKCTEPKPAPESDRPCPYPWLLG